MVSVPKVRKTSMAQSNVLSEPCLDENRRQAFWAHDSTLRQFKSFTATDQSACLRTQALTMGMTFITVLSLVTSA